MNIYRLRPALATALLLAGLAAHAAAADTANILKAVEQRAKIVRMTKVCGWDPAAYKGAQDFIVVAGRVGNALGEPSPEQLADAVKRGSNIRQPGLTGCMDAAEPLLKSSELAGLAAQKMDGLLRREPSAK